MAQTYNDAVITNDGLALLTKAQAGDCSIEFTRMSIGDGTYSDDEKTVEALQERTNLKDLKNSYVPSSVTYHSDTCVKIRALLTNWDAQTQTALITEGYYMNEIGLFAKEKDGDEDTEVLYLIAVTSGDEGDYMPAYDSTNPAIITQDFYATVDNALLVTISVVNGAFALQADVDDMIANLQSQMLKVYYDEDREAMVFTSGSLNSGGGGSEYVLPTATASRLGGIKIGNGLKVETDGTASVDFAAIADDSDASAAIVYAGTEDMTSEETEEAYEEAQK